MRPLIVKNLSHSSGKQLPLLCIDNRLGETEWFIQAMPLLPEKITGFIPIKAFLKNGTSNNSGTEVEKYFFDLPLSFSGRDTYRNAKPVFISSGSLKLANLKTNETFVTIFYSGINAHPGMHAVLYEQGKLNEFLTNASSSLHLINRFSFTHPDAPGIEKEFEFKMPFKDLFTLSGINPETAVKFFSYEPEEMKYKPLVTLQKSRDKINANGKPPVLLEKNGELVNSSNSLFFRKSSRAHTLMNSDIVTGKLTNHNAINNGLLLAELSTIRITEKPDLPLNEEIKPGLYKDRQKTDVIWYQDFLTLVKPEAGTSFLVSPFQFLFRVRGIDKEGRPALESEITVSLRCTIPDGAAAFNGSTLKPIPKKNISVSMSIPFMDNNNNDKVSDIISSSVSQQGDIITARFILSNEWTRVAYAAMSSDNVSSRPVKLKVSYLFNVYTRVNKNNISIVSLHKLDKLQIIKNLPRGFKPVAHVFVASQNTLMTATGMSIKYETAVMQPQVINTPAMSHANIASFVNTVPQSTNTPAAETEYKIDSLLYTNELGVFLACNEYGEFYQEQKDETLTPVGCKEPYKLGEVTLRFYTEITELKTPKYRVLRSNQVPNRFVIVPSRFVISRNNRDAPSPFTPDLILYSTFDVNDLTNSHSVLNATLQPDIEYFHIVRLTEKLKDFTSYPPDILFISEIESVKTYRWTLPEELYVSNQAITIGNYINYSLVCGVEKALTIINMLKSGSQGINGNINYVLPDGSVYEAAININIRETEGPWLDSPLLIKATAGTVEIENILDTTIDIAGLHSVEGGATIFDSLNISLLPKNKITSDLAGRSSIVPEYSVQPSEGSLEEVHSYSENIGCQLIFIDTSEKDFSGFENIRVLYSLADNTQYLAAELVPGNLPLEVILPIPLTKYLNDRVIRYKIQAIKKQDNTVIDTGWATADLSNGNIININTQVNNYFI